MKKAVIITAGGIGQRMGSGVPKQFLMIGKKPLIAYTVDRFLRYDNSMLIVLVIPEGYSPVWDKIKEKHYSDRDILVTTGGETRFESVKKGLSLLDKNMIIGIHDAVRPMVSTEVISRCYEMAENTGSAVPVLPLKESIRKQEGKHNYFVSREGLHTVQTPQVFRGDILKDAYNRNYEPEFTDDAIVVEKSGLQISLTEGNPENIKITTPFDLQIAQYYLTE